jgi:hypothetical protein
MPLVRRGNPPTYPLTTPVEGGGLKTSALAGEGRERGDFQFGKNLKASAHEITSEVAGGILANGTKMLQLF